MKRVLINFPLEQYKYLRKKAYNEKKSMSQIIRELLEEELKKSK